MTTQNARINRAVVQLEEDTALLHTFRNGTEDETVETIGGPTPTIAGLAKEVRIKTEINAQQISIATEAAKASAQHVVNAEREAQRSADQASSANEAAQRADNKAQSSSLSAQSADKRAADAERVSRDASETAGQAAGLVRAQGERIGSLDQFNADLANPDKGAAMVGYGEGSVADKLDEIVSGAVTEPLVDVKVDTHNNDADAHPELRTRIVSEVSSHVTAEADRAETAADAAQLSAGVFATTATGLAATTDGEYFSVPSDEATEYLILYLNEGGTATQIKIYPAAAAIDGLDDRLESVKTRAIFNDPSDDSDEYVFSIRDEEGYIALGAKRDGRAVVGGVSSADIIDKVEGEYVDFAALFKSDDGAVPLGFDREGDVHIGAIELETRYADDYSEQYAFPITDSQGNLAFGIDRVTGEVIASIKGVSTIETGSDADIDAVVALGARGTVTQALLGNDGFYRYKTDVTGASLPVLRKASGQGRAHVLNTSEEVGVHIGYGQSWRSLGFKGLRKLVGDAENERLITLFRNGGPIATDEGQGIKGELTDLANITTDEDFNIGRIAAITFLRLQDQHRRRKVPIAEICHAWGGSTWDDGSSPGGLQPGGEAWANGLTMIDALNTQMSAYGKQPVYRSVGWTQAGINHISVAENEDDLREMMAAYDALDLPGTSEKPLQFYIGLSGGRITYTNISNGMIAWLNVCRANANGRTWLSTPWYAWSYRPIPENDSIHTDSYGTARHGEMEGYAKFCVEELGLDWNPLWIPETGGMSLSGSVVSVSFGRPSGPAFTESFLEWDTDTIEAAESYGFRVYVNGVKDSGITVEIAGPEKTQVAITLSSIPVTGDSVEVSYVWRDGVVQDVTAKHSGLWGNLIMRGATSVLNPNWTLDAWAVPFSETLIA